MAITKKKWNEPSIWHPNRTCCSLIKSWSECQWCAQYCQESVTKSQLFTVDSSGTHLLQLLSVVDHQHLGLYGAHNFVQNLLLISRLCIAKGGLTSCSFFRSWSDSRASTGRTVIRFSRVASSSACADTCRTPRTEPDGALKLSFSGVGGS